MEFWIWVVLVLFYGWIVGWYYYLMRWVEDEEADKREGKEGSE